MNEQLQSKLVEILAGIQSATKAAGDFALEQLPDIAQQYVAYGRAYTLAVSVMSLLVFLSGFVALHFVKKAVRAADDKHAAAVKEFEAGGRGYRPHRESFFESSDIAPAQYAPFLFGAILFAMSLSQTLLAWFAPKVWLLKEIASLIK